MDPNRGNDVEYVDDLEAEEDQVDVDLLRSQLYTQQTNFRRTQQ